MFLSWRFHAQKLNIGARRWITYGSLMKIIIRCWQDSQLLSKWIQSWILTKNLILMALLHILSKILLYDQKMIYVENTYGRFENLKTKNRLLPLFGWLQKSVRSLMWIFWQINLKSAMRRWSYLEWSTLINASIHGMYTEGRFWQEFCKRRALVNIKLCAPTLRKVSED